MGIRKFISGLAISLLLANLVFADSSTSYTVDVSALNGGGNFSRSTTFRLNDTIIGFLNGQLGNSSSYSLGSGLVYLELLCGNGILEFGETCDDGNLVGGDGCNTLCRLEGVAVCGDGVVTPPEACDDGNLVNGDGCSSICSIEVPAPSGGGVVSGGSGPLFPTCGNKKVELGETCDDGNKISGDGCSNLCKIEKPKPPEVVPPEEEKPLPEELPAQPEITIARTFKIIAHPEKRVNAPENWMTSSRVVFYDRALKKIVLTASVNINGFGWGMLTTNRIRSGTYDISLKGLSHLTIILKSVAISEEVQTLDFTFNNTYFLVAGDVHESKDNFVNGLDLSATVLDLYSDNLNADLNHDGLVNALDISIVVGNLYRYGEKFRA